jgi:hypothetical protein
MTELICPHYTTTWKLQIQILILNFIELLGSLKLVITITLQIKYLGCYISAFQFSSTGLSSNVTIVTMRHSSDGRPRCQRSVKSVANIKHSSNEQC